MAFARYQQDKKKKKEKPTKHLEDIESDIPDFQQTECVVCMEAFVKVCACVCVTRFGGTWRLNGGVM